MQSSNRELRMTAMIRFTPNKTTQFYKKINIFLHILGLTDFWIEDLKFPETCLKIYNVMVQILNVFLASYVAMIFLALFTQKNLNEEQRSTQNIYAFMVPTLYFYYHILIYRRTGIRQILYQMGVLLKEVHNDEEVEKQMIKSVKLYVKLYFFSGLSMSQTGILLIHKFMHGEPLVTVITAWPEVTDESSMANIVRCIIYVLMLLQYLHTVGSHTIVFMIVIGLSHQFKNMQSYFYSLDNIFNRLYLSQVEKEDKFEKAFKAGIKMHQTTLRCTRECQLLCGTIFSLQAMLVSIIIIPLFSNSMEHENSPTNKFLPAMIAIVFASSFWCCAGNINVEASKVADAMYSSGWQYCYGKSSVRVRKLVVIAMTRAQKPVVLKALSFIELSYEAFWNLVMSAYTSLVIFY